MQMADIQSIDLTRDHGIAVARNRFLRKAREARDHAAADAILSRIIEAHPDRFQEHVERLDNAINMERLDLARDYLEIIEVSFSDLFGVASPREIALILKAHLKLDRLDEAMTLASRVNFSDSGDPRLGRELLQVLVTANQVDLILELAEQLFSATEDHPNLRARLFTILTRIGHPRKVLDLAATLPDVNAEERVVIVEVANAMLAANPTDPTGLEILEDLYSANPDDSDLRLSLSKAYLLLGRARDALEALELQPGAAVTGKNSYRQHVAETLLANNMSGDAGAVFLALAKDNPLHDGWRRAGVGAFLQAGKTEEATALYEEDRSRRRPSVEQSFAEQLALLPNKLDQANIPKVRFDWAWRTLQRLDAAPGDRQEWENACRFVNLADELTRDWLETRPDETDQVIDRFRESDEFITLFDRLLEPGRGAFVAGLHMGSLFAGPALLATRGVNFRWLASTPAIASMPCAEELISTTSSSRIAVARSVMSAINSGSAVTIAIDGGDPALSKRVPLAGEDILVTDFVPRMVFQTGCRSFFPKVLWVGDRLEADLVELIPPEPSDTLESFTSIWFQDFMGCVEEMCREAPDNLRLAGGFWRQIAL